jgi:hypothetical protein
MASQNTKHYEAPAFEFPLTPLLICLTEPAGKLPSDIVLEIPRQHACNLIAKRKAVPVTNLAAVAELVVDEADIDVALCLGVAEALNA